MKDYDTDIDEDLLMKKESFYNEMYSKSLSGWHIEHFIFLKENQMLTQVKSNLMEDITTHFKCRKGSIFSGTVTIKFIIAKRF